MRVINMFENIFSFGAVIVVSALAVVSVFSLNPSLANHSEASVAGISANTTESISVIGVINNFPKDNLVSSFDNEFTLKFTSLQSKNSIPAFKLTNFSKEEGKKRVEVKLKESLLDDLKIEIVDTVDHLILTSPILGEHQRTITIPAQSQREFDLVLSSDLPINFPIEIVVSVL